MGSGFRHLIIIFGFSLLLGVISPQSVHAECFPIRIIEILQEKIGVRKPVESKSTLEFFLRGYFGEGHERSIADFSRKLNASSIAYLRSELGNANKMDGRPIKLEMFLDFSRLALLKKIPGALSLRIHAAANVKFYGSFSAKILEQGAEPWVKIHDPFSLESSLTPEKSLDEQMQEILQFKKMAEMRATTPEIIRKLKNWISSPERAVYVYAHLDEFGSQSTAIMRSLIDNNPFMKDVRVVAGTKSALVTYAYEKETPSDLITLYYRDASKSDQNWLDLSSRDRLKKLKQLAQDYKPGEPIPASVIAPTTFKPVSAGALKREINNHGTFALEMTHHSFEISPSRMISELNEITDTLKETHSIHTHIVFSLPTQYPLFNKFENWAFELNYQIYLKGMEEGMHATTLVSIPRRLSGVKRFLAARGKLIEGSVYSENYLPVTLESIGIHNFKLFSAAIRAGIYGPSPSGTKKIGIELRDISRNMPEWEKTIRGVGRAVSERIWEKRSFRIPTAPKLLLAKKNDWRKLTAYGISKRAALQLIQAEPTILIPLQKFESATYFNYVEGGSHRATPEQVNRIQNARLHYIDSLKDLERELAGYFFRKEKVEWGDLRAAIQMAALSVWAKEARVAELFGAI